MTLLLAQLSQSATWFKNRLKKRKSQDFGSGGNLRSTGNCNDNEKEKEINTNNVMTENNNISPPTPKSAPNSPLKKASHKSKLQRTQSSEHKRRLILQQNQKDQVKTFTITGEDLAARQIYKF